MLPYHIGGPDTSLPFFVESFLGWSLCLLCLAVSGFHYGKSVVLYSGWHLRMYRRACGIVRGMFFFGWVNSNASSDPQNHIGANEETPWIPLTTHSRAELDNYSPWQRYLSLLRVFEKCYPMLLMPIEESRSSIASNVNDDRDANTNCRTDSALIRVIRCDRICRRLASLAMRPYDATKFATPSTATFNSTSNDRSTTTLVRQCRGLIEAGQRVGLLQRMSKLWNYFLVLPPLEEAKAFNRVLTSTYIPVASARNKAHANDDNYPYRISLILPSFCEKGAHLFKKLIRALKMAEDPNEVEVVIVDAGGCSDLELLTSLSGDCENIEGGSTNHSWGRVAIFTFASGGGRGPCLNFGASVATGRILTFCHSDTSLPHCWDQRVVDILEHGGMSHAEQTQLKVTRVNSCAFAFGIDTSPEGLSMPFESSTKVYCPPGIRAVEVTANMRTRLYSLPYGDQVLSLHACIFEFLGGFPDQCLMEDYELVSLLRQRAASFVPPSDARECAVKEQLSIIPGAPALCSPRRWQKNGVLYVTFMNSKLVNLYAGTRKIGPDELFQLYYGRTPPKRNVSNSPWELELAKLLEG